MRAYTYHLFKTIKIDGFDELKDGVFARQAAIIEAARKERRIIIKILSLILARGPLEEIQSTANYCKWLQPWEIGLLALIFSTVFPEYENPFTNPSETLLTDWKDILQNHLTDHSHNIEFGLTMYLASMSVQDSGLLEKYQAAVSERADDEIVKSIYWLLKHGQKTANLNNLPYYLWSLLKATVLRSSYIAWESDVSNRVERGTLEQQYIPDYEVLIS